MLSYVQAHPNRSYSWTLFGSSSDAVSWAYLQYMQVPSNSTPHPAALCIVSAFTVNISPQFIIMDPITGIGLAASVVQLVQFGTSAAKTCRQIYQQGSTLRAKMMPQNM